MNQIEQFNFLIDIGYKYNQDTGEITNSRGRICSRKGKNGYIYIGIRGGANMCAHRFAWYYTYNNIPDVIDHINRIKDDNRISNLRDVKTISKNNNNRFGQGYYYDRSLNKYRVRINHDGKKVYDSLFEDKNDAINTYIKIKNELCL